MIVGNTTKKNPASAGFFFWYTFGMNFIPMFSIILGVCAGILQVTGYFSYFKKIGIGRVKPNAASWGIWAFGAVLESSSYVFASGDWVKNMLPIACSISAVVLFLACLRGGHFERLTRFEWFLAVLDCLAIFIWWRYESAVYANLFLVITAVISFVPLFVDVWNDPMVEDSRPWVIWTIAYTVLAVVVMLRWEKWEDIVYPGIFIILHAVVAVLALDKRVPKTLQFKKE